MFTMGLFDDSYLSLASLPLTPYLTTGSEPDDTPIFDSGTILRRHILHMMYSISMYSVHYSYSCG